MRFLFFVKFVFFFSLFINIFCFCVWMHRHSFLLYSLLFSYFAVQSLFSSFFFKFIFLFLGFVFACRVIILFFAYSFSFLCKVFFFLISLFDLFFSFLCLFACMQRHSSCDVFRLGIFSFSRSLCSGDAFETDFPRMVGGFEVNPKPFFVFLFFSRVYKAGL